MTDGNSAMLDATAATAPTATDMRADVSAQPDSMSVDSGASGRKRCQRCNGNHLLRMFPVSKSSPDGRHPLCFVCWAEVYAQRWPRKPR